jgi:hypothetical protein
VSADHLGSGEDLCYGLLLKPRWVRNSIDPVLGCGGDFHVYQQSLEPADGDWSLDLVGLPLICVMVQLLIL